ncbi:MAG: cytochrome c3 family protein [Thermoanaerobaculia bacterium]
MNRRIATLVCVAALVIPAALPAASPAKPNSGRVANTLHNLSVSGPGDVKSLTETEICKFCHIPHNPVVREQLWSQPLSAAQYDTPMITSSAGRTSPAPQPDGASRLCLSCHDGTVAIGNMRPRGGSNGGSALRLNPGSRGYLGTDLSGSHPVSFIVTDAPPDPAQTSDIGVKALTAIQSDIDVRLDAAGKMQCTSCHDPHDDRNFQPGVTPHFLVKPTTTEVCLTCHELR